MSRAGKIGYIAFYCCVAVAFASVLARIFGVGADRAGPSLAQADPALEQYVLQFYRDIDDGNYDIITAQAVEGKWRKGEEARQYFFAGILDADEFRQHLLMDYGKDGWQIRFVTLRLIESFRLAGKVALLPEERRDAEIIAYLEKVEGRPLPLGVVVLEGHVSGRCNIINWRRRVVVADPDGKKIIISRGTPDDYEFVRREQWFTPVKF